MLIVNSNLEILKLEISSNRKLKKLFFQKVNIISQFGF